MIVPLHEKRAEAGLMKPAHFLNTEHMRSVAGQSATPVYSLVHAVFPVSIK